MYSILFTYYILETLLQLLETNQQELFKLDIKHELMWTKMKLFMLLVLLIKTPYV